MLFLDLKGQSGVIFAFFNKFLIIRIQTVLYAISVSQRYLKLMENQHLLCEYTRKSDLTERTIARTLYCTREIYDSSDSARLNKFR